MLLTLRLFVCLLTGVGRIVQPFRTNLAWFSLTRFSRVKPRMDPAMKRATSTVIRNLALLFPMNRKCFRRKRDDSGRNEIDSGRKAMIPVRTAMIPDILD